METGQLVVAALGALLSQPPAPDMVADGTANSPPAASGSAIEEFHQPVEAIGGFFGAQMYPYDSSEPWIHGYTQEIPAYGGHSYFRPYNYRHLIGQSKAATAWGFPRGLPYSQQFWHRYSNDHTLREPARGASLGGPEIARKARRSKIRPVAARVRRVPNARKRPVPRRSFTGR